jgi:23S rRNA (guanine1835-N2)-methyltransferase
MTATPSPTHFQSPYGTFELRRYPARTDDNLLAWCSADTLALDEVHRREIPGSRILVVNDTHGALCVALQPQALWTDSALAVLALRHNERSQSRIETPVFASTQTPTVSPDLVLLRIPKQRTYFEYQLSQIALLLPQGATVLAAGMDKHLSRHTAPILEHYIGPTQRLPGQRKARLFCAVRDDRPAVHSHTDATYYCAPLDAELRSLPNVFSQDKLDIGTRFLLEYLHLLAPVETAIDLACGNGVLGLVAAKQGLARSVAFCDESALAIASAQFNASRLFPHAEHRFQFHHGDGLEQYAGAAVQLILCNPPFHQEHTVNEYAGRRLLNQCSRHLLPGGHLLLVANRHLDYLPLLRNTFLTVEKCASNSKFNIVLARKD